MSDVKDQFECWIDEGVQRYVAAEPPLGLEARVLARLGRSRERRAAWRLWMIAVPVAVVLALVIGQAVLEKTSAPPKPAVGLAGNTIPPKPTVAAGAPSNPVVGSAGNRTAKVKSGRDARQNASPAVVGSRPEQFPAPAPASEQERLLARLVRDPAATQTVAARAAEEQEIVISGLTIKPIEIPLLPGPNQGE